MLGGQAAHGLEGEGILGAIGKMPSTDHPEPQHQGKAGATFCVSSLTLSLLCSVAGPEAHWDSATLQATPLKPKGPLTPAQRPLSLVLDGPQALELLLNHSFSLILRFSSDLRFLLLPPASGVERQRLEGVGAGQGRVVVVVLIYALK